jgi:hypothetical protein
LVPRLFCSKERPRRDANPSHLLLPWSWKGRAIALLALWSVRPVQSRSFCTRVTFTYPYYQFLDEKNIMERRKRNQTKNKYKDAKKFAKHLRSFKSITDDLDRNALFAATTLNLQVIL